jgi:hypothetical protein
MLGMFSLANFASSLTKYFIKVSDKERKGEATHFLLDGGIWCVPKEQYPEFLNLLAIDLQNGAGGA